ncbi:hypothetical protein D3C87_1482430 [compost metagenome]
MHFHHPAVRIETHFFQVFKPENVVMLLLGGVHKIEKPAVFHYLLKGHIEKRLSGLMFKTRVQCLCPIPHLILRLNVAFKHGNLVIIKTGPRTALVVQQF